MIIIIGKIGIPNAMLKYKNIGIFFAFKVLNRTFKFKPNSRALEPGAYPLN